MKNKNTRINLILFFVLFLLYIVLITSSFYIVQKYLNINNANLDNDSQEDEDNNDDENGDDDNTIVKEFSVIGGLNAEYYLDEPLQVTDIIVRIKTRIDNIDIVQNRAITTDYVEGELPTTSTVGTHTITLVYLDARIQVTYKVVAFDAKQFLKYVSNRMVKNMDSIFVGFDLKENIISDLGASNYYQNIKNKIVGNILLSDENGIIAYTATEFGVNNYIDVCYNAINYYETFNNLYIYSNIESGILPYINKDISGYNGGIWLKVNGEFKFYEFIIDYYSETQGIKFELTQNEVNIFTFNGNFSNKKINIAINYGDSFYINDDLVKTYLRYDSLIIPNLYEQQYDNNFLSNSDKYLMMDINTNSIDFYEE